MNFFNIGAGEFFLILVVLMIVFGPQRLPQLARQAGKAINDLRKFASEIDPELLQDFREVTKDLESVRAEVTSLRSDLSEIQRDVTGAAKDVTDSLNEVVHEVEASTSLSPTAGGAKTAAVSTAGKAPGAAGTPHPSVASGVAAGASAAATAASAAGIAGQVAAQHAAGGTSSAAPAYAGAPALIGPDDEIVGRSLPLRGPGDGASLDEIVGVKVFPVQRSAAHVAAPEPNGHDDEVLVRSRHAVMASLSQRRQTPANARPAARAPVRPRTRERLTRRG